MLKTLIIIAGVIVVMILTSRIKNAGITMIGIEEARDMVHDSGVLLLDVRTPSEYAMGHIKGAKLIPVDELADRAGEIADCKERPVLVYCHSGNRSATAAMILKNKEFSMVRNLRGGITAWINSGNNVVKN
jgi:phage shock protein E